MTGTETLLCEYANSGSETAFRELVARYLDLVYSTALRQVAGDRHLAEDVAQTVFVNLAQKAKRLPRDVMLGGWLHRDACHVAATLMRSRRRRAARERYAAEMSHLQQEAENHLAGLGPVLDVAIDQLGAEDRRAILLRFFEERDFRSVGVELGSSEDAARMRVNRALEKLQSILKGHGFALTTAALAAGLASDAVVAAPAGLAATIAGTALAGATGGSVGLSLTKLMTVAKFKAGLAGIVALAALAAPFLVQHQSQVRLRQEAQQLREQLRQLGLLQADKERLSNLLAQAASSPSRGDELSELLRLRGQAGQFREANKALATLEQENAQLRRALAARPASPPLDAGGGSNRIGFVFVSGEVQFPNRLVWTNGMSVAAAIEIAHGFTAYADRSVFRLTGEDGQSVTVNSGGAAEMNSILLQPGDKVFVPRSITAPPQAASVPAPANAPPALYTRVLQVNPQELLSKMGNATGDVAAGFEQQSVLRYLNDNGVVVEPPSAVYLDASNGTLRIRASLENLDRIEQLFHNLPSNH